MQNEARRRRGDKQWKGLIATDASLMGEGVSFIDDVVGLEAEVHFSCGSAMAANDCGSAVTDQFPDVTYGRMHA